MRLRSELTQRGFLSLAAVQLLSAGNDNILKGVLLFALASGGVWSGELGEGGQAIVSLCLTIPFITLSGFAGQICDRFSKQRITVIAKAAELVIALLVMSAFWVGSLWLATAGMLLMGIQSSFIIPAKYGAIPELVEPGSLSRANGSINMATQFGVIGGAMLAGPVYLAYDPSSGTVAAAHAGEALVWVPGALILGVAVIGLVAALAIPPLRPRAPGLVLRRNPLGTYLPALREMAGSGLLIPAFAWALFFLVGMMAMLAFPDYRELLGVDPIRAAALLGIMGISLGAGSALAGLISGRRIEMRLVPVGAVGAAVGFALLGVAPLNYGVVAGLTAISGLSAGLYIVPLQALMQQMSPDAERGRFLGTANALGFLFGSVGSLIFFVARTWIPSNHVFLLCALLWTCGMAVLLPRLWSQLRQSPNSIRRAERVPPIWSPSPGDG
ncbi:MAG: MFS transporter [bacterium]|nr:MFS transporter [bacterium]